MKEPYFSWYTPKAFLIVLMLAGFCGCSAATTEPGMQEEVESDTSEATVWTSSPDESNGADGQSGESTDQGEPQRGPDGQPCWPKSCEGEGFDCGAIDTGCGEAEYCGDCPEGEVCGDWQDNMCDKPKSCSAKTCDAEAKNCGALDDGCGGAIYCGDCPEGQVCGGGGAANRCAVEGVCEPTTCEWSGHDCGAIIDGCGGAIYCGECPDGTVCGGGGDANKCACLPTTCEVEEKNCGVIDDGCGFFLNCGECTDEQICGEGEQANICICALTTCESESATCGLIPDGCGEQLHCGHCESGATCTDNQCECVPNCDGILCGGDGCGGVCGACENGLVCVEGQCSASFCAGDCNAQEVDCGPDCQCFCDKECFNYQDCCADICVSCSEDYPDECCQPECNGAECGDDGCGGSCGECLGGALCIDGFCGVCVPIDCAGNACGDDGCGGSCGDCSGFDTCDNGQCIACQPQCDGKECGDDGCGGVCGSCDSEDVCLDGECSHGYCSGRCGEQYIDCGWKCHCFCDDRCFGFDDCCDDVCVSCGDQPGFTDQCCQSNCAGKTCGDDGCGGSCGDCGAGQLCDGGQCMTCQPQCDGKECGEDGCGGSCGNCQGDELCESGLCIGCVPDCNGKECGPNGCSGVCGQCAGNDVCGPELLCVPCVPDCTGKLCGDDGCGGSCGDCGVDCDALSSGPFTLTKLDGPIASEDLAFDDLGHVVGSNDKAIFKSEYGGSPQVWVPNFQFRAGLRYLPSGDLLVNNDNKGQLARIEPDGTVYVVLNNLKYPNGMVVDANGYAYVTEHDAKRVIRVEPYSESVDVLSEGVISNPNGIAFNPDHTLLYVAGFSGAGIIYAFPVDENGDVGEPYQWATNVGTGWLDGIGVDICGNVYIADYYATEVLRLSSDATNPIAVIQGQGNDYLPNMQWGSGLGGWDPLKLYLPDGWQKGVFEVDIGVPGSPSPFP